MEVRPEGMERWGLKEIVKESWRLVRMHRRLFQPFYLAFCLSGSLLSLFPLVLVRSTDPSPSPASTNDQGGQQVPTYDVTVITMATIAYIVVPTMVPILSALGLGGVAYIVAYIYSNDDDDTNVTNKVFKLLPHALLRSFVTALWTWLLLMLVFIAHFLLGLLLYTITGSTSEYFLVFAMIPWFISAFFLSFLFVFSQVIAVLEPAHYGRDALHRSARMVKVGGAGTILAVGLVSFILFALVMNSTSQIWNVQPELLMYFVGVLNAVCISILNFYVYVVSVVMYFVYTSRLDAAVSTLPKFAASASMDHPYKPLAAENPPVGEP